MSDDNGSPDETGIELSDAGRYTNIIAEDEMVASYDEQTGEFCVYDPHSLSEDPEYIVDVRGDDE